MSFLNQFEEYTAEFSDTKDIEAINGMTGYLKIFNKITWLKGSEYKLNYVHYVQNINFDIIKNKIVETFFYDDGEKEEKLTISDDDGKNYEYKYKKDEEDENITKFYVLQSSLSKIEEIFKNAKLDKGGVFSNPADKTIGKIFEEIDNRLFKNSEDQTFLEHLKFEYLEPLNPIATNYMKSELKKGEKFKYYFHVKFFQTLIEIFIDNINEVKSLYQAKIKGKEAPASAEGEAAAEREAAAEGERETAGEAAAEAAAEGEGERETAGEAAAEGEAEQKAATTMQAEVSGIIDRQKGEEEKTKVAAVQEEESDTDTDFSESDIVLSDSESESESDSKLVVTHKQKTDRLKAEKAKVPNLDASNQTSTNKVSDVNLFGNEDSLEILKNCLEKYLKKKPILPINVVRLPRQILYPFIDDDNVKIETPDNLLIIKDIQEKLIISPEKLNEIIDKIYSFFKTKCFNIGKNELSRFQKILIVCEFILVVIEYIKKIINLTNTKDTIHRINNAIKFYEYLYEVFYKEIFNEFLNSKIPDEINKEKLNNNIFSYYCDNRKLSIEKSIKLYDEYMKVHHRGNDEKEKKLLKCIKCTITRILNIILSEGLTYKKDYYIKYKHNLYLELKKIITNKILENIKKAFGSDSDDNIYKKIFNFFTIYFQDNPIADSAQCNNESITIQECETDTEQEPASPQQTQQTPLQQTPLQQTQETPQQTQPPQPPQQTQQTQETPQPPSAPPPSPPPQTLAEDKKLEKNILNYIFEYDNEKEIKKRINFLKAKYGLDLNEYYLNSFALYSDSLKDILDISKQQPKQPKQPKQPSKEITTRDVNTFIDILAKYKFSYNLSDIESDIKKLKKLCSKLGIGNIIDNETAMKILNRYFPSGKLDKSKLEHLYEGNTVKLSNESENLRAFNIFLKSLEKTDIKKLFNMVYKGDGIPNKTKKFKIFKELFSDSDSKFKISSISNLF
jgi:hypothetical protein